MYYSNIHRNIILIFERSTNQIFYYSNYIYIMYNTLSMLATI